MAMTEEPIARYRRAQRYFDAQDYSEAARLLTEVVDAVPAQLDARLLLARACYHSAQLHRAERELRLVLERDPAESYARLLLGRTLQRLSRDTEAAGQLRLAAALTGRDTEDAAATRRLAPRG